jgi:hypothetical protein
MSQICKLIAKELSAIVEAKKTEPGEVKPSNYLYFEENLPGQIEILTKIKEILSAGDNALEVINEYMLKNNIEQIDLLNIATSQEELNDQTNFYFGNLDLRGTSKKDYDQLYYISGFFIPSPNTNFPNLKIIEGGGVFTAFMGRCPSLEEIYGMVNFERCYAEFPKLKKIHGFFVVDKETNKNLIKLLEEIRGKVVYSDE